MEGLEEVCFAHTCSSLSALVCGMVFACLLVCK
jgi:tetrahydromethanopterin S-methyltransferase subunit F